MRNSGEDYIEVEDSFTVCTELGQCNLGIAWTQENTVGIHRIDESDGETPGKTLSYTA